LAEPPEKVAAHRDPKEVLPSMAFECQYERFVIMQIRKNKTLCGVIVLKTQHKFIETFSM